MNFYISNKMSGMRPSAIREFFKYAADPAVISMSAGSPAPEALPTRAIREIMDGIMREDLQKALGYSISEGYPPLRESLKIHLRERYASFDENRDELIVTSGAQQCMDLICRVLCDEGDVVICEDPSFTGSVNCFRSYGIRVVGVPMEEDGISVEQLEQALKEHGSARFIYLIPNFQNPTGYTMSLNKRRACYDLAKKHGVPILEDDPYGDLRFSGEPLPAIKTMDEDGIVLYARTFSKVLSAGIRVGYLSFPKELLGPLTVAKQCADVHTGMLSQLLCHRFLTQCDLAEHIREIGEIYGRKCALMLGELDKLPPGKINYTQPEGGLFVWAALHGSQSADDFATRLVKEKKVAVVPGSAFFADMAPGPNFRMTFAAPAEEQIVKGISAIAELLG